MSPRPTKSAGNRSSPAQVTLDDVDILPRRDAPEQDDPVVSRKQSRQRRGIALEGFAESGSSGVTPISAMAAQSPSVTNHVRGDQSATRRHDEHPIRGAPMRANARPYASLPRSRVRSES